MPKRAGVSASIRLSKSLDVDLWNAVADQHQTLVKQMGPLGCYQNELDSLADTFISGPETSTSGISKKDLMETIIRWKFAVGKPRHALKKHLESNSEEFIRKCSLECIQLIKRFPNSETDELGDCSVQEAVSLLTKMKGVGPATASVLLSAIRPDWFSYLYDEVIDTFLPKRTYTLPTYLECNRQCNDISNKLVRISGIKVCERNGKRRVWTPALVAQTLWTAARVSISEDLVDYTLKSNIPVSPSRSLSRSSLHSECQCSGAKLKDGGALNENEDPKRGHSKRFAKRQRRCPQ